MLGQNQVRQVSTKESHFWPSEANSKTFNVITYDFGIKYNILRIMTNLGMSVTLIPWNTNVEEVKGMNPHGIFLSNGPGEPAGVNEAVEAVRKLLGKLPIFGICLGHQILSLALGCQTYKLACGQHGENHPVIDFSINKIENTSHNHGFSVDEKSLPKNVSVRHRNLIDKTIEGIESLIHSAFSVQYHPEVSLGPRDA